MTLLVVSTCCFQWTWWSCITCKLSYLGTVAESYIVLAHSLLFVCCLFEPWVAVALGVLSLWLFDCIVSSFTATRWPLQKSSCYSAWLHPALHEWTHSHDRFLNTGLWHRWVKTSFLLFVIHTCNLIHTDLEGLLAEAPWHRWWNRCTFGWDEAKEQGWTPLLLKIRCFYLCLSVLLLLVCNENNI